MVVKKSMSSLEMNRFNQPIYIPMNMNVDIIFNLKHKDNVVCSGVIHSSAIKDFIVLDDSIDIIEDKVQEESTKQKIITYIGSYAPNNIVCFNVVQFNSVLLAKINIDNVHNELVLHCKANLQWEYESKRQSPSIILSEENAILCNAFGIHLDIEDGVIVSNRVH